MACLTTYYSFIRHLDLFEKFSIIDGWINKEIIIRGIPNEKAILLALENYNLSNYINNETRYIRPIGVIIKVEIEK